MKKIFWSTLFAFNFLSAADAQTFLYFTSSRTDYVGSGQTLYATPAEGYNIGVSDTWRVDAWCYGPGFNQDYEVLFQAANYAPLTVGHYSDTREPGVDPTHPSLDFFGQSRADTGETGYFDILALTVDTNGVVTSFAADFVQYDLGNPANWLDGSIRFNSSIPVPEPNLPALSALAFCSWVIVQRLRAAWRLNRRAEIPLRK